MAQRDTPRSETNKTQSSNWPAFWLVVGVIAALGVAAYVLRPTPSADGSAPVTVVVRSGDDWRQTTSRLESAGLVRNSLSFQALVLASGARAKLLPGRYSVSRGTSARDIINELTSPSTRASITIPEGFRLGQIGERMVRLGLATGQEWTAAVRSATVPATLGTPPKAAGIEGYIFPGTYAFTETDAARQLINDGMDTMAQQLRADLKRGFAQQNLTVHQAITIASIVEREAHEPAERPVIASVYLNRLRIGMKLQADPTVQYAVGKPGEWWKQALTRSDLNNPSPYNTYVQAGLPPGPIASPGLASLQAVASPATTQYLYMVAKGDGTHAFAATLEEHNLNVRRYLGR